jgi:hypothetical protein
MTDEQIAKKKQNAGAKKPSMKRRDDHHDYTERRIYMITIEAEGRRPLFGTLKGDPYAPADSEQAPHIQLSEIGQAIQNEWMGIHDYYPQIEVKAIQMMPDHLHGILFVTAPLPVHLGQVISGFKAGCRKALRGPRASRSAKNSGRKQSSNHRQCSGRRKSSGKAATYGEGAACKEGASLSAGGGSAAAPQPLSFRKGLQRPHPALLRCAAHMDQLPPRQPAPPDAEARPP